MASAAFQQDLAKAVGSGYGSCGECDSEFSRASWPKGHGRRIGFDGYGWSHSSCDHFITCIQNESRIKSCSRSHVPTPIIKRRCRDERYRLRARVLLCLKWSLSSIDCCGRCHKGRLNCSCTPVRVLLLHKCSYSGYMGRCHARARYHGKSFSCSKYTIKTWNIKLESGDFKTFTDKIRFVCAVGRPSSPN
ncbi:N-acetylglucosamine-6-sulfatase [Striga asiatica]|uniref:N-acetylglucosamine-6-sulfatase n=1 Tax=Striga asiatica TaxID=4170 RepID=A0A5A7PWU5_STRAF|nr:N-acetylglucosamine-6-sulfatase [Striga asiatica]